jgi:[ribosomal protein S18]-alanine N-acetyltransferase
MTGLIVERLTDKRDLDGVLAIEEASFNNPTTREWYEGELRRQDVCFVYVIRTPEVPVAGFCAFWRVAEQLHINNLAILPELRGRGLGSHLLQAVLAEAAKMGADHATLEVRRSNLAALRLYERAGFTQAGVRWNYYNKPVEDALVLVLEKKEA